MVDARAFDRQSMVTHAVAIGIEPCNRVGMVLLAAQKSDIRISVFLDQMADELIYRRIMIHHDTREKCALMIHDEHGSGKRLLDPSLQRIRQSGSQDGVQHN